MILRNKFFLIIISSLCCFIQGCQNIPPSKTTIAKSPTIIQFVKNQYASDFKVLLDNISDKVIKKYSPDLDDYTEKVLPDNKSVIWRAFFTDMNSRYLYKPRDDIKYYCTTQQGRLVQGYLIKNVLTKMFPAPSIVIPAQAGIQS